MSAEQLVTACRELVSAGLSPGSSGNASIRAGNTVFITPGGLSLARITAADISIMTIDGEHRAGPRPTKEWAMHTAAYASRPDDTAIVHVHAPASTAVACLRHRPGDDPLPAYTPYRIRMIGRVEIVPYAPPGSQKLALAVGVATKNSACLLLANHGSLVCASSMTAAVDLAQEMEAAAALTLALHGRDAAVLDSDTAW
ncbi:class II aldolase/adducin family protein [Microbacterium sp. YY-01]|uniref:class II aldolase/adducin family protein n=1 Tax=Microbacterium sp. YY-01 TaxID=3421634 RepID=UPI003D16FE31